MNRLNRSARLGIRRVALLLFAGMGAWLLLSLGMMGSTAQAGDPIDDSTHTPTATLTGTPTTTSTTTSTTTPTTTPTVTSTVTSTATPTTTPTATPTATSLRKILFLPQISRDPVTPSCPQTSDRVYSAVPVTGPPADHPDVLHGDLNLSLRGYEPVSAALDVVEINGPTDPDAPQLAGIFSDNRAPDFSEAFQVYDWDWGCSQHGCRGDLLSDKEVTLLGMVGTAGEPLSLPQRAAQIYPDGFIALVLYAEPTRLTVVYAREDTVANGYAVHLEDLCVDPALVALYTQWTEAGRGHLPGLRAGEVVGVWGPEPLKVAVRDRGSFMDPRSRKDWWQSAR